MAVRCPPEVWFPGLCKVCLSPSSGIHYGAETCEGCKAFYKRSLKKEKLYRCFFGENCKVGPKTANRCKACRLRRCISAGMRPPSPKKKTIKPTVLPASSSIVPYSSGSGRAALSDILELHIHKSRFQDVDISAHQASFQDIVKYTAERAVRDALWETNCNLSVMHDFPRRSDERLPIFLKKYISLSDQRNSAVEETMQAVVRAGMEAYQDELENWTVFLESIFVKGQPPPAQPQTTMQDFTTANWVAAGDTATRMIKFAKAIPGYSYLDEEFQRANVREKTYIFFLVHRAAFTRNNEHYFLIGPSNFHFCRFWVDQIFDPLLVEFTMAFSACLNSLKLNQAETFLVMAVALVQPSESLPSHPLLQLLYAQHLDALRHLVLKRHPEVWQSLFQVIDNFHIIQMTFKSYVAHLDTTKIPCLPCPTRSDVVPISKCLTLLKSALLIE